jgi:hypothetical protein
MSPGTTRSTKEEDGKEICTPKANLTAALEKIQQGRIIERLD